VELIAEGRARGTALPQSMRIVLPNSRLIYLAKPAPDMQKPYERLAIEMQAASADHLERIDEADIRALALSNVVCTLLPGCCFHLGLAHYAPARKLIEAGAIVGLATDFNPGTSPTVSMPMILSLACTQMRMTPAEAISAATINPAYSLRQQDRIGSLEVGKYADFAAFDVADYREIPYYFGVNLCSLTMKRGNVIYSAN